MKNVTVLWALVVMMAMLFTGQAVAEEVTGCPLGLKKGEFWVKSQTTYLYAERALWTNERAEKAVMMDMPENWHQRMTRSSLRLGYGITDRLDVGLLLAYFDKHVRRGNHKQKPNGSWFVKEADKEGQGFGDVWLSAKYKIVADKQHIESISLGAGFRLDASDDCNVTKGIGSGAKAFRAVLLTHEHFGQFHFCNHLYYEWQGDRRGIDVRNQKGELVKWEKSGQNIGDKIGYKFNVEYCISKDATIWAHLGLIGWHKFEDQDCDGVSIDRSDRYEHSVFPKFVWLPQGPAQEHHKIFLGVKCPYKYRRDFESHVIPVLSMMWTWGGESG